MQPILHSAIKNIYNFVPFKPELFKALRKIWSPSESIYRHLHFKGIIKVPINKCHSFKMMHYGYQIENEVFWSGLGGNWEKQSISLWMKLCLHSKGIFDIGANTGIYSLIAKTLNPIADVYAFEPVKRVFKKLENNNRLNNYNIHCEAVAVSDYDGEGFFFDSDSEHTYSVTLNKKLVPTSTIKTNVKTIRLDSFIEKHNIETVDLLKIDVETHEAEVLYGLKSSLPKFKPTILVEILYNEVGANVEAILNDFNYLFFHIDEKKGIKKVERLVPSHPNYNFLLCHETVAQALNLIPISTH